MDQQDDYPEFKVIIKSDKIISVQLKNLPDLGDIPDEDVNLDLLKKQTIDVLIEMLRDNRLLHSDEFKVLGSHLFSTLFCRADGQLNEIGVKLHSALNSSEEAKPLRVQLVFENYELTSPWLEKLPWEYLFIPESNIGSAGYFLSALTSMVLVRYLPTKSPILKLQVDTPPVKVLFVASSAHDLPQVQYESVLTELEELAEKSEGKLQLIRLEGKFRREDEVRDPNEQYATFARFRDLVSNIGPHVIHFVGHGRISGKHGQIAFMHEDGKAEWVNDEVFANFLWDRCRHKLRLVFLQACDTARLPNPYGAISGVAQKLAYKNIPAVVAMQYEIKNQIANTFARAFYNALASAKYIDEAVQVGRQQVAPFGSETNNVAYSFGLPVLYMRQTGGLLPRTPTSPPANVPSFDRSLSSAPAPLPVCPYCQTPATDSEANFCRKCAAELFCPQCRKQVRSQQKCCEKCGYLFKQVEADRGAEDKKGISVSTQLKITNEPLGLQTGSDRVQ